MNSIENLDIINDFSTAVALHQSGQLNVARTHYLQILEVTPENADVIHLMGVLARQEKNYPSALHLLQRAIKISPDSAIFHVSLGDLYRETDDFQNSVASYRRALSIDSANVHAWCNLGNAFQEKYRHDEALKCYRMGLTHAPQKPELYHNIGLSQLALHRMERAMSAFQEAVALQPDYVEALLNLANILRDQDRFAEAEPFYVRALRIDNRNPDILFSYALFHQMQHQFEKAEHFYLLLLEHDPENQDACINLGKLYHDLRKFQKAKAFYQRAEKIDPQCPDLHFNRSLLFLTTGEFENGWRDYEARFSISRWRRIYPYRLTVPRWRGESLTDRCILVHSEQGFGDTIQFARYLQYLKRWRCKIRFEVKPELLTLFQGFPGVDELVPLSSKPPAQAGLDYYIPLLSLPFHFQTSLDTIPAGIPYLFANPDKQKYWQSQRNDRCFNVGVVWQAKTTYRHTKSCAADSFLPLLEVPNVRLYGLQKSDGRASDTGLPDGLENWGQQFANFDDTAAAIACLDLIVSVDTAVAHLAGALAKPVWTLLPFSSDWRWLENRKDSPWYPTMRLYRQSSFGDWNGVIKAVARDLEKITVI